jgi:hypothetical protein
VALLASIMQHFYAKIVEYPQLLFPNIMCHLDYASLDGFC